MTQTPSALPTKPVILVVGATGFLGAKILRQLQADPAITLRAMSRRAPRDGSWVQGDLMDPASLDRAMQGVDVVVSSANGYMKETIAADFQGNKNLIEAAARAGVKRFVFLSIVACDKAPDVPHFHAKKVAEDLIRAAGLPFVFVRAPAFLDQADDYLAKGLKKGKFYGVGDRDTRWSYVLTDDLADCLAKAATHPDPAMRLAVRPVRMFSDLGYDLLQMFMFFQQGRFNADTVLQERFFGAAPTARDALSRWCKQNRLI
jgi:uncharacterized protein YbjT (DUF2867 family)